MLLCSVASAADALPTNPVDKKEFPALQILPVGTVLEGITFPRYEGARVTSLMEMQRLLVLSKTLMRIVSLDISIFSCNGETMHISSDAAEYDFEEQNIRTQGVTRMVDPSIRTQGKQIYFDVQTKRGMLKGPVRTVFAAGLQQAAPKKKVKTKPKKTAQMVSKASEKEKSVK